MPPRKPRTAEDQAAQKGLGRAVAELRSQGRSSREEIAKRAGLHPATIAAIEDGKQDPTWGTLRRLAQGLSVDLPTLNALAYKLAPGPTGARLRQSDKRGVSAARKPRPAAASDPD